MCASNRALSHFPTYRQAPPPRACPLKRGHRVKRALVWEWRKPGPQMGRLLPGPRVLHFREKPVLPIAGCVGGVRCCFLVRWLAPGKPGMKITRQKHAKKHLGFFRNNFGVREPYQILLDGTFCQAALRGRIQLREQLPRYLMGEIQLCTTRWAWLVRVEARGPRGCGRGEAAARRHPLGALEGQSAPPTRSWQFSGTAKEGGRVSTK